MRNLAGALLGAAALVAVAAMAEPHHFVIRVEDSTTGEPLGCATLTTTGQIVYTSDDNGIVALYEPGLMDESVFFTPERQGYFYPADFLGIAAKALDLEPGGFGTIEMTRNGDPGICNAGLEGTLLASRPVPSPEEHFRIEVRDAASGRPVPLVFVRSPRREHTTDSNGLVAFYDPEMMGRTVFFEVDAHGYDFVDPDGDGGLWMTPTAGEIVALEVTPQRDQIATRLYRVTGGGIYRDTALLGEQPPLAKPFVNGLVMGQDTVFSTLYRGRPFYIWGDTNKPSYPLGNFKVSGATSVLPADGGLDPSVGVDLVYFTDATGFTKELAPEETVPNPPGEDDFLATWLGGLTTAPDANGEERLYASYGMFEFLTAREKGVVRWNDDEELFYKALVIPEDNPLVPHGPAHHVRHGEESWIYYHDTVRVPRSEAALLDLERYEAFTAFLEGTTELDRTPEGELVYDWRKNTRMITQELIDQGLDVAPEERLFGHMVELGSEHKPLVHENGSTFWNDYRGRYVRTVLESFGGPSFLGEIWFVEADTPLGPWVFARKVVTHDDYSFYNPMHHPFFDQRGGRDIFFEGTYTTLFTSEEPTARYDYNQVMYKLDLTDERLRLPVPVYDLSGEGRDWVTKRGLRPATAVSAAPFLAWDRPVPGAVPVYWSGAACDSPRLVAGGDPVTEPIFYGIPAAAAETAALGTVPLVEHPAGDGGRARYALAASTDQVSELAARSLIRVWPNPIVIDLPVTDYLADLIADAGPDQCLEEEVPGGGAPVTLDASASSHATGEIVDYRWYDRGSRRLLATGEVVTVTLAPGLHSIALAVADADGERGRDSVAIQVDPAD